MKAVSGDKLTDSHFCNNDHGLEGKEVLVVGMARSGLGAAELLHRKGVKVKVSDKRPGSELERETQFLRERHIEFETGGHSKESCLGADVIVVSPGVPLTVPEIQSALRAGREVISEIELASRFLKGRIIGITGSNGKTTTTTLIGEILRCSGLDTQVGGNIGTPLTALVEHSSAQTWNVVELSSFQLEAISTFRPYIAVVLNITPDHMDRYDSFRQYADAKLNIHKNQTQSDYAVLNYEDQTLRSSAELIPAQKFWFSLDTEVDQGTYLQGKNLFFRRSSRINEILSIDSIQLPGRHNLENVSAAVTVSCLVGVVNEQITEAVSLFRGVEHRLEFVTEIAGVRFYNDSKATNPEATVKALEAFDCGIVLILGGRDKGSDFAVLKPFLSERVKAMVLLGEAAEKIRGQLLGTTVMRQAESIAEAVRLSVEYASVGDVVLLAPACASFDMFENYEHRGKQFKEAVFGLKQSDGCRNSR